MPELPEVETVRRGLEHLLGTQPQINNIHVHQPKLRVPVAQNLVQLLRGQHIHSLRRRAKYLLWDLDNHTLITHLGMTGSWRFEDRNTQPRKHDHVIFELTNGYLVYNDPRRFGFISLVEKNCETQSSCLKHLGVEPLDKKFNANYLHQHCQGKQTTIKSLIMDQKIVVGVGNIYASEALFKAKLRPSKKAKTLTRDQCKNLVSAIKSILKKAIESGGTTIRDYKNAEGKPGYFYQQLQVYGRCNEKCRKCKTPIKNKTLAQRSTYWCPKCQH